MKIKILSTREQIFDQFIEYMKFYGFRPYVSYKGEMKDHVYNFKNDVIGNPHTKYTLKFMHDKNDEVELSVNFCITTENVFAFFILDGIEFKFLVENFEKQLNS